MSSCPTAFQTTRGARTANSELASINVSVGGRVAYRRAGRFQVYPRYSLRCPQENETCRRRCARTAHTKERILELAEAAVLETGFGATVIGVATGWLSQPS